MDEKTIAELCRKHTIYSWAASGAAAPLVITRAEGVHVWTADGTRLLDFASQALSVHIGHGHPAVRRAMKEAADGLIFSTPSCASESKARLGELLARVFPGDLNSFFFTLGGADANENAIKMARQYTGRGKVIGRYRGYHGATHAASELGGDPRRRHVPDLPGFVHILDIEPHLYQFGASDDDKIERYLRYVEETIWMEGPEQIAAMFVETVPGTNGVLVPPAGYLARLAALLRDHGILLVCDEVMTGFGRTGKMFAFEHHSVTPDLVTCAKGLSSSYVPLGCVAVSQPIADYFQDHVYWGGATYSGHPFVLAVARAAIEVLIEERMVENAAEQGEVLSARLAAMAERHRSVVAARSIGLFAALELAPELFPTALRQPDQHGSKASKQLGKRLRDDGLFCIIRHNNLFVVPPLCIARAELDEGLDIIDRQLEALDATMP
jgi:taurine--2-oxoglutarate transaminase